MTDVKQKWSPPALSSGDLKGLLAEHREAARTLKAGHKYGLVAYHLGYVLEFTLKACICRHLGQATYPTDDKGFFKTHSLTRLYMLSGLQDLFNRGKPHGALYDSFTKEFLPFGDNWTNMRYDPKARKRLTDGRVVKRMYNTLIGHGRSVSKSITGIIDKSGRW